MPNNATFSYVKLPRPLLLVLIFSQGVKSSEYLLEKFLAEPLLPLINVDLNAALFGGGVQT
jgi:hypothetical protein